MSLFLSVVSQWLASASYNTAFWDGHAVELDSEIHDHALAKTIKEKTAFEVNQDEMDRIDKILQTAQKLSFKTGCCSCLTSRKVRARLKKLHKKTNDKQLKHLDVRSLNKLQQSFDLLVKRVLTKR